MAGLTGSPTIRFTTILTTMATAWLTKPMTFRPATKSAKRTPSSGPVRLSWTTAATHTMRRPRASGLTSANRRPALQRSVRCTPADNQVVTIPADRNTADYRDRSKLCRSRRYGSLPVSYFEPDRRSGQISRRIRCRTTRSVIMATPIRRFGISCNTSISRVIRIPKAGISSVRTRLTRSATATCATTLSARSPSA